MTGPFVNSSLKVILPSVEQAVKSGALSPSFRAVELAAKRAETPLRIRVFSVFIYASSLDE
jgi:hypothetical protein